MRRYYDPKEFEVSARERNAARRAATSQGSGQMWGGAIGGALGGGLGALGLLGGPGLAAVTLPAGLAAGSALGGAIGGQIGAADAAEADGILSEAEAERVRKLKEMEMRQRALDEFGAVR